MLQSLSVQSKLEVTQVRTYFDAPELERPIKTGGEEVGREVHLSGHTVTVYPRDGPHVPLEGLVYTRLPVGRRNPSTFITETYL
jgi:hypothetical protein